MFAVFFASASSFSTSAHSNSTSSVFLTIFFALYLTRALCYCILPSSLVFFSSLLALLQYLRETFWTFQIFFLTFSFFPFLLCVLLVFLYELLLRRREREGTGRRTTGAWRNSRCPDILKLSVPPPSFSGLVLFSAISLSGLAFS